LRDDRGDRDRALPHAGVLCGAAHAHGQPAPQIPWRGPARRSLRRILGLIEMYTQRHSREGGNPVRHSRDGGNPLLRRLPIAAVAAMAILAGCATPPPIDPAALPVTPAAFKEAGPNFRVVTAAPPDRTWWTVFRDPVLDDLVARADRGNSSIRIAAARLVQARALLRQADADRVPQVGAAASVARGDGFTVTSLPAGHPLTLYSLGANASWEADLFGKLSRAAEAADLDAQASQALLA